MLSGSDIMSVMPANWRRVGHVYKCDCDDAEMLARPAKADIKLLRRLNMLQ